MASKDFQPRFLRKFNPRQNSDCWEWVGTINSNGYGVFWINAQNRQAHRISYEIYNGSITEGFQIDHVCRNKLCVNPNHLEAVTPAENMRRMFCCKEIPTHCRNGHEYTPENIGAYTKQGRICLTCKREWRRSYGK